jgi:hypothetical protein
MSANKRILAAAISDCSRTLPLKLTVSHLLKELSAFYGARIRKALGSNPYQKPGYYDRDFMVFNSRPWKMSGWHLDNIAFASFQIIFHQSSCHSTIQRRETVQKKQAGPATGRHDPRASSSRSRVCTQRRLLPRKNEAPRCHVTDRGAQ